MSRRLSLVLVLVLWSAPALRAQGDPTAFAEELARIERFLERREHDRAAKAMAEILVAHEGQDYVRARRQELIEIRRRIDFGRTIEPPDPKTLVAGKLSNYSRNTGQLQLDYELDGAVFFSSDDPKSEHDFVRAKGFHIHKLSFAGPFELDYQVTGDRAMILLNRGQEEGVIVEALVSRPEDDGAARSLVDARAAIVMIEKGRRGQPITEVKRQRGHLDRFELGIKVSGRSIEVSIDGRRLLRADNDGRYGNIAIQEQSARGQLMVKGKAEPSFLQDRIDRALAAQRKEFEKVWDPKQALPGWLFEEVAVAKVEGLEPTRELPGNLDIIPEAMVKEYLEALATGETRKAADCFAEFERRRLDSQGKAWLEVQTTLIAGRMEKAVAELETLLEREPRFLDGHRLRANLLMGIGRREDARLAAEKLVADFANDAAAFETAIPLLLTLGRTEDGRRIADGAIARGIASKELVRLDRMLVRAQRGPDFPRRYEHVSEHYRVVSDIDSRICRQAALLLEQGHRSYAKEIVPLTKERAAPFEVYIFSGQDGYNAYSEGILGRSMPWSAGLYSPMLKQLLIWNAPIRENMDRTIRHEGFHQYLDRVLPTAPIWFNEGLAEYNETGKLEFGKWKTGELRRDYARLFARAPLLDPAQFMALTPRQFQQPAMLQRHYGQAWLMVHYLLHGGEESRKLFDAFVTALAAGRSAEAATREVFGEAVTEGMSERLMKHLAALGD